MVRVLDCAFGVCGFRVQFPLFAYKKEVYLDMKLCLPLSNVPVMTLWECLKIVEFKNLKSVLINLEVWFQVLNGLGL